MLSSPSERTTTNTTTTRTVDDVGGGATTISAIHPDVLLTHILSRLDGPTLASASCASSQIQLLSTEENLWETICHNTWPSTDDPRMRHVISTFKNGPRSFISDSYPYLTAPTTAITVSANPDPPSIPPKIISAVDLRYKDELIYSKVHETDTEPSWVRTTPFRVDLLDPKDVVRTPIIDSRTIFSDLEENLTLSWIVVDPIGRRSANFSSWKPVSLQRHWLSGEVQVKFATVLGVEGSGAEDETTSGYAQCGLMVALGGCEGGEMQVREVSLRVEDMDGINLNGKGSLGILVNAMERGERKKGRKEEGRERFEEYLKMKIDRREKIMRREKRLDSLCLAVGVSIFSAFWMFFWFR